MKSVARLHSRVVMFVVLLWASQSFGQAVYGNIIGTVTDPSGAAVPSASVTISDLDRGVNYTTTTNAAGNYQQRYLLAGHYMAKVSAGGVAAADSAAGGS